jgi:DNA-binding beta-propeller fold protein YncE
MSSLNRDTTTQYNFLKTIGNAAAPGQPGFRNPVDVAPGPDGLLYVLNHAAENSPNGKRVAKCTLDDDDFLGEFGSFGSEDGQFTWPNSLTLDREGNVYVSDEWLHRISVFDPDGGFIHRWGTFGVGAGQFNRPAGVAFDGEDNLLVADSMNHRIQKYTKKGQFITQWGEPGQQEGQLNTPWGLSTDSQGNVYVADWRNDRIQKFAADGHFLMQLGASGDGDGQFNRPSGVAVDQVSRIYVVDWGNDRVQVFDEQGSLITKFLGDAGLSKWGVGRLSSNPENMIEQRARVGNAEAEKWLTLPTAVEVDQHGRIIIVDSARHRLQIYVGVD